MAAELKERGSKFVCIQHGGAYGSVRYNPCEVLERRASDEYWSWGWGKLAEGVRPMPNPKLSRLASGRVPLEKRNKRYIFFPGNLVPRYHYRTGSGPTANQVVQYLEWQIGFLNKLRGDIRVQLIFRPYPKQAFGLSLRERLRDSVPDLNMDNQQDDYYSELLGASLVVCDMNQTSLLESLAANIPTIVFWDENLLELREEAEYYFQLLRDMGILYHSPSEAANAVNTIWPNVENWWQETEVQHARDTFVHHYARNSKEWIKEWRKDMLGMLYNSNGS